MPGWYGHEIEVNIDKSGANSKIDLVSPCEVLANEVNSEIANMVGKVEGGVGGLVSEIAHLSHDLQVSALTGYGSNKSGTLVGSITEESSGNSARIGTDLFYAQYLHDGRGSVTATNAKVLHFYNDGVEVFVKSVGPSTPKPYVDDSSRILSARIDSVIGKYLDSV